MNAGKKRRWLALAACLCVAPTAHAEDFNITVPIEFTQLPPEVAFLDVTCEAVSTTASVGAGRSERIRIEDGAFVGELEVRFNARIGLSAASATHYRCTANLSNLSGTTAYLPELTSAVPGVVRLPTEPGSEVRSRTGDQRIP